MKNDFSASSGRSGGDSGGIFCTPGGQGRLTWELWNAGAPRVEARRSTANRRFTPVRSFSAAAAANTFYTRAGDQEVSEIFPLIF